MQQKKTTVAAPLAVLLAGSLAVPAFASSHMDAPLITLDPAANTTDAAAFRRLLSLWGTAMTEDRDPCGQAQKAGLACLDQRGSWAQVRELNRPAILSLTDDQGQKHRVVLSALLDEVSRDWFGDFTVVWKPKTSRTRLLSLGMHGDEVRWLRRSLHALHGSSSDPEHADVYDQELAIEFIRPVEKSCVLTLFSEQPVAAGALELAPPQRTEDGSGPSRLRTSNAEIRVQSLRGSLDAQTSNGSVELIDVDGDAKVHTSNGHIRTEGLRGSLDAGTSNSSINARLEQVPAGRPVRLETSNSSVELSLPANFANDIRVSTSNSSITLHMPYQVNAHVMARTTNSSISSDFEIKMQGDFSKNRLEGVLGNGGDGYAAFANPARGRA